MTDLYEAGDINQTEGGEDAGDVNHVGTGDAAGEVGEGNERHEVDGGTPLAVLTYLTRALSNEPDAVVIETEERRHGIRLNVHVAPEDMGRVIGRRGRTAQAIRTLINVAGAKDGVQASVDIVDD
jgi:predicted RNA-binding protein YlqC (UPF0109 family)